MAHFEISNKERLKTQCGDSDSDSMYFSGQFGVVYLVVLLLMGCSINTSIRDLNTSQQNSSPGPILTIDDGDYNLSLSQSPLISWSSCLAYSAEIRIVRASDETVLKPWTPVVSATVVNELTLSIGARYWAEVRCLDSSGSEVASGKGDGWTVPTGVTLIPSNTITLIAGESKRFAASGGVPNYVYSSSASSFIETLTGIFKTPLGTAPTAVTVMATDSVSQSSSSTNVIIRAFEEKLNLNSSVTGVNSLQSIQSLIEHNGALFIATSTVPFYSVSKPVFQSIFRSNDNGATWLHISDYYQSTGFSLGSSRLVDGGSSLFLTGAITGYGFFIAESLDSGLTWNTRFTNESYYGANNSNVLITGAVVTSDNSILLAGYFSSIAASEAGILILKCHRVTWVCTTPYLATQQIVGSRITKIERDASGNFYMGVRRGLSNPTSYVEILKSTNQGNTWISLYQDNDISLNISAFAVSTDGQMILYGGASGASVPYAKQSTDGGATFTSTTSSCSGWEVNDIVMASNKDAMLSCYNYNSGNYTGYINYKAAAATAWTNTISNATETGYKFFTRANGDVVYFANVIDVIRSTSDFGMGWTSLTHPTFSATNSGDAQLTSILEANSGHLYATGLVQAAANNSDGIIYRSTDSGATWASVASHTAGSASFSSLAQSGVSNNMMAAGVQDFNVLIIYKFDNSNSTWASSDSFTPVNSGPSQYSQVFTNSVGHFYAVGNYHSYTTFYSRMLIRYTTNEGGAWSTLDDFVYPGGYGTYGTGGVSDGNDIYISGYAFQGMASAGATYRWLVRKYSGGSWTMDEDDNNTIEAGATHSMALGIMKAADGALYAIGSYRDVNSVTHWVVKKKPIGGSWAVVDNFNLVSGKSSAPTSIAIDASQRIVVSGYAYDSGGVKTAIIRSLTDSGWATIDSYAHTMESVTRSIAPCLSNRLCAVGSMINDKIMSRGFLRILSP